MAMASVVVALASMFRDMGAGAAIIQRKKITSELTSTIFWTNLTLGTILGLALWLGSSTIGRLFQEPQLPSVLTWLAIAFPLGGATTVHQAVIERRLGFKTLAAMDVTNQLVGVGLGICAALSGAGVYSFVVPTLSSTVISAVWLWREADLRLQWSWNKEAFAEFWGFAGNLTAFNFINYFARNADSMIIGRLLGAVALGSYSMAYKVMLFPLQNMGWVVNRVMLPRLSELQDDRIGTRNLYFKTLAAVLAFSAPIMVGLWIVRNEFVGVVFGPKWGSVPALLAWLAPVGLLQSMLSTVGSLFIAAGKNKFLLRIGLVNTVIFIIGFLVGAQWGIEGVAIGYLLANLINSVAMFRATGRHLDANFKHLWEAVCPPLVSVTFMALGMVGMMSVSSQFAPTGALSLLFICALGGLLYTAFFGFFFRSAMLSLTRLVR
jgi:PST family polysaccharide transporter